MRRELLQHAVEQRLVPAAGGEHVEQPGRPAATRRPAPAGATTRRRGRSRAPARRRARRGRSASAADQVVAEPVGMARVGQPARPAARPDRTARSLASTCGVLRKLSQMKPARLRADAVLVGRDDRGVRNRQAERMAEQRDHREPVGDRADHRGLGEGRDVAPGRDARACSSVASDVDAARRRPAGRARSPSCAADRGYARAEPPGTLRQGRSIGAAVRPRQC